MSAGGRTTLVKIQDVTPLDWSLFQSIGGGLAAGFASGFAGSLLNGGSVGDAFRAGAIGGMAGAVTGGLLGKIGSMKGINWFERGMAHGLVQGASAEATGGEFRHGFYAGFAVGSSELEIKDWTRNNECKGVAAASIVGGTAASLGGGKFANGAIAGAFSYLFNALSNKSRYWIDLWGKDGKVLNIYDSSELGVRGGADILRNIDANSSSLDGLNIKGMSDEDVVSAVKGLGKYDRIILSGHGTFGVGLSDARLARLYSADSALMQALSSHLNDGGSLVFTHCYGYIRPQEVSALKKLFNGAQVWSAFGLNHPTNSVGWQSMELVLRPDGAPRIGSDGFPFYYENSFSSWVSR